MKITSEKEEEEAHDESVSKVEERADKSFNLELGGIEVDAVDEEVDGCESTSHERPPPPVIVLTASHHTSTFTLVSWSANKLTSHITRVLSHWSTGQLTN